MTLPSHTCKRKAVTYQGGAYKSLYYFQTGSLGPGFLENSLTLITDTLFNNKQGLCGLKELFGFSWGKQDDNSR